MLRLLTLFLLVTTPFVKADVTDADYGLGNIVTTQDYKSAAYDVVIFVNDAINNLGTELSDIENALVRYNGLDTLAPSSLQVVPFMSHPSKRMIFAPTGKLNTDTADSRLVYNAAAEAAKLAYSLKLRNPVFVLGPLSSGAEETESWHKEDYPMLQMSLGALQGYYMPYVLRTASNFQIKSKFDTMSVYKASEGFIKVIIGIEKGRIVHRDTCASDPQVMAPPQVQEYYEKFFKTNGPVKMQAHKITYGEDGTYKNWPLIEAVNRAVSGTDLLDVYGARVIKMQYDASEVTNTDPTIVFAGKGICYDTGGSELKINGNMKWMRKDKCGATSAAGFMKVLEELEPPHLKARAHLAFVRNGIGANAYVYDEIVTTTHNVRTLQEAPDAEGRNVMTDMISDAVFEHDNDTYTNPYFFTIATLTGAVSRNFNSHTAIMDNGPARAAGMTKEMVTAGDNIADIVERMTIRKEDYDVGRPHTEVEDILQFNTKPRTATYRGVQLPAAFMATAGGIDDFGLQTRLKKIPYTHLDVSASVGVKYIEATARPTTVFVSRFVLPRLQKKYGVNFPFTFNPTIDGTDPNNS